MTTAELDQVKMMVLRELPRVLEQDPEFARWVEGLLSEKFPKRDEFARLLDELENSRKENRQQFSQVGQRFQEVDQRFQEVDQRFDQVNQRFDQVDQRLDRVDQRLDRMDQQFEHVNQRFDHVELRLGKVEQDLGSLTREVRGLRDWMELNVGGFQTRAGRRLEDVVAGAFCYGLRREDIKPEDVRVRQLLEDTAGLVWRPGRKREVDSIAIGQETIVFEVKSTADRDDVEDLAEKVALVRHLNPTQQVSGVLVMLGAERDHRRWCEEKGLRLIP